MRGRPRAGVSESTLYRYFPTKRDLFAALGTRQFLAMVDGLDTDDLDGLRASIGTVYRRTLEGEQAIRWTLAAPDPERIPRRNVDARLAMLRTAAGDALDGMGRTDQTHTLRLLLLLTSPMAMLYWHDYLGLAPADAGQDGPLGGRPLPPWKLTPRLQASAGLCSGPLRQVSAAVASTVRSVVTGSILRTNDAARRLRARAAAEVRAAPPR